MLSPQRGCPLTPPHPPLNHRRRSIQRKGFSPLAFQTAAHSADLNHVVHERGKYAPIRWLARSPSDAIDELEAYRVGGALLPSPYLACSLFVRRPTWLLGALAATAMAAARWMMLVTRWTVERRRRRRDKLYFKMVVRIITAAAVVVRPPDRLFAVPPPPSPPPPPPRSMRAEKGS